MTEIRPTRNLPVAVQVDPSDTAGIAKTTRVISSAFHESPICIALIADVDRLTPSAPHDAINADRIVIHFTDKIRQNAEAGAVISHAGDWSAVSIWEPPNFFQSAGEPPVRQSELLSEWKAKITKVKAEHLGIQDPSSVANGNAELNGTTASVAAVQNKLKPHWHLGFLGRNPTLPSVPGAISGVVLPFLDRARDEGVPAWLEATTPYAVGIYEHFGFRVLEKVTIGVGRYGEDGWPMADGPGLSCWAMIYDSHLKS